MKKELELVQIAVGTGGMYGLDRDGKVWFQRFPRPQEANIVWEEVSMEINV